MNRRDQSEFLIYDLDRGVDLMIRLFFVVITGSFVLICGIVGCGRDVTPDDSALVETKQSTESPESVSGQSNSLDTDALQEATPIPDLDMLDEAQKSPKECELEDGTVKGSYYTPTMMLHLASRAHADPALSSSARDEMQKPTDLPIYCADSTVTSINFDPLSADLIEVNQTTGRVYAAVGYSSERNSKLVMLEGEKIIKEFNYRSIDPFTAIREIAVDSVRNRVYAVDSQNDMIFVYENDEEIARLKSAGNITLGVAVNEANGWAYVISQYINTGAGGSKANGTPHGTVTVIDRDTIIGTIDLGEGNLPKFIVVDSNGQYIYVAMQYKVGQGNKKVSIIRGLEEVATYIAPSAKGLDVADDGIVSLLTHPSAIYDANSTSDKQEEKQVILFKNGKVFSHSHLDSEEPFRSYDDSIYDPESGDIYVFASPFKVFSVENNAIVDLESGFLIGGRETVYDAHRNLIYATSCSSPAGLSVIKNRQIIGFFKTETGMCGDVIFNPVDNNVYAIDGFGDIVILDPDEYIDDGK